MPQPASAAFDLRIEADAAAVAEVVAERLLESLEAGRAVGLATGRTMEPVYAALRRRLAGWDPQRREDLLAAWCSFNLDEYVGLGPEDPGSFAADMHAALAVPLGLAPGRLQLPDGLAENPDAEARRYGAAVSAAGGIRLQLLGLGGNGHVGFNEPPCPADAPCRCLELSDATRRQNAGAFGGDPAAVPARAITLGTAEILAARRVLLVVTGAAKAEILRRSLQEPPSAQVPASWLQRHPRLQVVVDAAAAAQLDRV
ncbi:MAG: glucosamine-6-phosphate deaminase [Vulcanococcus sp.]